MPHYVNIALGNFLWQGFLYVGSGQLFGFGFSPLKFQIKKKTKPMCCMRVGSKSMT
jgi:hypothetical protein